ncbi:MAG: cell division protein FtsZ, partial [Bacteroidaceae bacterium]|nr:cell division protein FtsZ [Bacteroidaceae bacterium]
MNESIKNFEEKEVLDFGFPTSVENIIKVIGVGGGGSNAVENMYRQGIHDVGFVLANTDHQALNKTEIPIKIQLGKTVTNGLGAGNDPEVAKRAAEESKDDIELQFKDGTKMVFITAGMGGGTGTGAAPVIAKYAKEAGMLTVGIVTIPFKFEQRPKIKQALAGVKEMAKQVDAL